MSWVDFIASDLHSKIRSGEDIPARFTLQSLCDWYGVSMTPVRAAVRQLIKKGDIVKKNNGRLAINPKKTIRKQRPRSSTKIEPPDDFFEAVARDLVLRSLEGKAYFLREEFMARKYCVSRTVLRRIFHRLSGTGIIEHLPRRGWVLRPFSKDDLAAFLQVREVLELKALELARNRLEPELLDRMFENSVKGNKYSGNGIDNSLHCYLIEKSQNRYIRDFFEHHGKYYEVLFACEDMDRKSAVTAVAQHRKILKALLNKDWRKARKALSEHIHTNHVVLNAKPELILKLARRNKLFL